MDVLHGQIVALYLETDLVVPTWNAAFVDHTPAGAQASLEIVEFANSQLLQFRYYDELLDNELGGICANIKKPTRGTTPCLDASMRERPGWRTSVGEKLKTLDDIYRFSVERLSMVRGEILEIMIVAILVFELVLFFMGIMH